MSELDWKKVEQIVDKLLELPPEQRTAYIEKTCGNNQRLKKEVTQLVESIFDSEGWLKDLKSHKHNFFGGVSKDLESLNSSQDFIGQQVGDYTIKKKIGQGGMGLIYLAERTGSNFDHQVAIKIIRHNQATETNIERFRREQRILAGLKHPGIAQLYDGGVTDEGFPYIIMEYVDGMPITDYCRQEKLPIADRIELFKQVLQAVQYAHENLVIHRDLKPDNILVNSQGKVKILDFGISILLDSEDDIGLTRTHSRILTPKYAAPEQIKQANITTATDLYSLGIVFYQLLSNKPPFDLSDCTAYQAEQIVLTEEPTKPSLKVDSKSIAQNLRGDLNGIALKAIRKDPEHRYRVAAEFLDDLDKYENGLPVSARTDSFQYRAYKFFGRHKQSITAAGFILILIIGFSVFYTWKITEERNFAQQEAQKARAATNFLTDLIEANAPGNTQGKTVTIRQFLDSGFKEVQQLKETPIVQAEVLTTMGHIYRSLGEIQKASTLINRALEILKAEGIKSSQMAESYNVYGIIQRDLGNYDEAQQALQESIEMYHATHHINGEAHAKSLRDLAYVERLKENYDKASRLIQKTLDIERGLYEEPNIKMAETLYIYASILRYQKKYSKATEVQKKSLAMVRNVIEGPHPGVSTNLVNLANLYKINGEFVKSTKYYKEALQMSETLYGEEHHEIANINNNLGGNYLEAGRLDSAEYHLQKAITIERDINPDSPLLGKMYNRYAQIYAGKDEFNKADSLLSVAEKILKNSHSDLITVKLNRTYIALQQGNLSIAKTILNETLQIDKKLAPSLQHKMDEIADLINQKNDQAIANFQPEYIR